MRITGKDTFNISVKSHRKVNFRWKWYDLCTWDINYTLLPQRHTATHPAHGLGNGLHHTPDQAHFAGRLVQSHHDVIHRLLHELRGLGDGVVGMRRLGDTCSQLITLSVRRNYINLTQQRLFSWWGLCLIRGHVTAALKLRSHSQRHTIS